MHRLIRSLLCVLSICAVCAAAGVPPRPDSSDYPAHSAIKSGGEIAAAILPADKVSAIFSPEVNKHYLVIEIAVYPDTGHAIDLLVLDFALKTGDERVFPVTASEVAWHGKRAPNSRVSKTADHVVGAVGIGYGTRTNPVTGRAERGVDTWGAVGVDSRPQPNAPNAGPNSADRTYELEGKLQTFELPEGPAARPVAGYLYFPIPVKKAKGSPVSVEYSHNGERLQLPLQVQ